MKSGTTMNILKLTKQISVNKKHQSFLSLQLVSWTE